MTKKSAQKEHSPVEQRIILTLNIRREVEKAQLTTILTKADFASVIIYDLENDEALLQKMAENYREIIQGQNCALLIANDSRIAGRVGADGVHIEGKVADLQELMEKHHQSMIVGFGNPRDKHTAMEVGECEPDYVFFGKCGADQKDDAHPRNLNLAAWWSEVMEIPAIVQAGAGLNNFPDVLATGAEFIAVENLLFSSDNIVQTLEKINIMMNQ